MRSVRASGINQYGRLRQQIGTQPMTSDAAGNLIQDRADRELVYDAQNRLTSVKLAGNTVAEFRYNALGQRTHKIGAQGTSVFLYGPDGQLLGESLYSTQGVKLRSQFYLWLDSLLLGGISVTYDGQGAIASSTPFYLHSDHLGTPRLATNQSQQNVWQWQSDAFGVGQASGSLAMNLRFPGQYLDQETGLHYNYFRDYDPQTGRYVESDPIGLDGGLNTYGYVNANPLTYSDPQGLNPGTAAGAGIGTMILPGPGTVIGAIIGTGLGVGVGYLICSDDDEDEPDSCEKLNEIDTATCTAIARRRGAAAGAACHASASQRYAACLRKQPLPPLNTWNN